MVEVEGKSKTREFDNPEEHFGLTLDSDKLTVFSLGTCHWCDKVKDYLKQNGVDYQSVEVDTFARRTTPRAT